MESVEILIDKKFWKNKKVFLTGHTGFKGAWLSLWLHALQVELTGYALPAADKASLFQLCDLEPMGTTYYGDIRDLAKLTKCMQNSAPDIVFHLAAQPLVRKSYRNAPETYSTNVMGTVHLLEAVRNCPSVKAVVVITTDKCYENKEWDWGYRETDTLGGHDPYAASKACAELVTASYRQAFLAEAGVFVATARAGNVIGGGDWSEDRLVPDFIRSIQKKQPIRLRNSLAVRPWQFVLEPLRGYLLLAEKLYTEGQKWAEGWNLGPYPENNGTVLEVAKAMCFLLGGEYEIITEKQFHESMRLELDIAKAEKRLHWSPCLNRQETLHMTADWYAAYLAGHTPMKPFSLQQIKTYEERVKNNENKKTPM